MLWKYCQCEKRSDENVPVSLPTLQVLKTQRKFWNTWRNSLKQAETDRNLQIFTDTHNNPELNMNVS